MKHLMKSEIQFKQTPAHIQKAINTAVCEYWSAPFSQLRLHPQTNQTVSPNAEAFFELQRIPRAFTTSSFLFPALHFPWPQAPADPLPLVLLCGGTLRSDNFLQCPEAVETLCGTACFPVPCQWGSPDTRQQWEASSQHSRGLGRLEGGSCRQISSKVGGLVGIMETDIHI